MDLSGKALAKEIKEEIRIEVESYTSSGNRAPHLAAILVGEDGASRTYVKNKENACARVGFESTILRLPDSTTEEQLLEEIEKINQNKGIDGLIVQLPLPKHIDSDRITQAIDPAKDVDGFHDETIGKLTKKLDTYISATPFGIMQILERYNIETTGKHCVVVGRSNIVGRPISIIMNQGRNIGNATVTTCHRHTDNLKFFTSMADILIVAIGRPDFITADMVKPGATVIDVGITRVEADNEKGYVLKGDVDYEAVKEVASHITPVPGGVGPMTIIGLLQNTLKSYKKTLDLK
jgi:methylenetetrahydrofolate dehydrogenase (NADP+)/methenyltetrahydrofolate cyclohydrolase